MSAVGPSRHPLVHCKCPLLGVKRTWAVQCKCLLLTQSGHQPHLSVVRSPPPTAVPTAIAIPPAATAPSTAATAQASPVVIPTTSPPLHVCHIIAAVGSRRRKREDRCRVGSSWRSRKDEACKCYRKHYARHYASPVILAPLTSKTYQRPRKLVRSSVSF